MGAHPFTQNMDFSYAIAVTDTTGGWVERKDDAYQIAARFGACIRIYTKAAISLRSKDMENFMSKFCRGNQPDFRFSLRDSGLDTKEPRGNPRKQILWFLQDDIEVQCIMQWGLLSYLAQSHLNNVFIRVGVLQACHDRAIQKAMVAAFNTLLEKGTRRGQHSWKHRTKAKI